MISYNKQMNRAERIHEILNSELNPVEIVVENDSGRHRHHDAGGEDTHFNVKLVSEQFKGLNHISRHRRVNSLLSSEFESGLHALSLDLKTPDEV